MTIGRYFLLALLASGMASIGPAAAQNMLDAHNAKRSAHCVKLLTWSTQLEQLASAYAPDAGPIVPGACAQSRQG